MVTIAIFTEPEVTNCFSKIALKTKAEICDSETSTNLAAILKTESRHCYNHLAVIIARENEVLDQSARAIFDNYQCNFTKRYCNSLVYSILGFGSMKSRVQIAIISTS